MDRPLCKACGFRPVRDGNAKGRRPTLCELCRKNDKHRNRARTMANPWILVGVDCESGHFDIGGETVNRMVTMSLGRTDGTSASIMADPGDWLQPLEVYDWLRDNLSYKHSSPDGTIYRQQSYGFHFNHDIAMLLHNQWDGLELVHKSTAKERGLLCGRDHPDGEECLKFHRFSAEACREVLRNGGEGDLLAWDPKTQYAFATAAGRRFYMEYRPNGDRFEGNKRLDVHDIGRLFVGGFEQVIDLWQPELRDGDREIITWGKANRKLNFADVDREQIALYSEAECVSLARLAEKFLATLKETVGVEMSPHKLFGSGSVAAEVMKFFGVPKRKELAVGDKFVCGIQIDDIAQLAYWGGKIEGPVIGVLTEPAYPRDINSAYPSKAIYQPCMRDGHGHWSDRRGHVDLDDQTLGYTLVSWDYTKVDTAFPPFMVRNKAASVFCPQVGARVWSTMPEYQAAVARWGRKDIVTHHTVWWEQECECPPPLEFLADIYDRRREEKRLGNTGREEVLKLIINSAYGKLAQRKPQWGALTNLHWAAMITGATRAQLNEEAWSGEELGGTPVYAHTDSMTFVGLERPDEGKALGAWGAEPAKSRLLVVQPGIAVPLDKPDGKDKAATRGVKKDTFIPFLREWAEDRMEMFRRHPNNWEEMAPDETRMTTLRQAHHVGKPHLAGSFFTRPQKVGFYSGKREFDRATPLNNANPYAWKLPPKRIILPENMAQLEDLESYRTLQYEKVREGLFDHSKI